MLFINKLNFLFLGKPLCYKRNKTHVGMLFLENEHLGVVTKVHTIPNGMHKANCTTPLLIIFL